MDTTRIPPITIPSDEASTIAKCLAIFWRRNVQSLTKTCRTIASDTCTDWDKPYYWEEPMSSIAELKRLRIICTTFGTDYSTLRSDNQTLATAWASALNRITMGTGDELRAQLNLHAADLFIDAKSKRLASQCRFPPKKKPARAHEVDPFIKAGHRTLMDQANLVKTRLVLLSSEDGVVLREAMQHKWSRDSRIFKSIMADILMDVSKNADGIAVYPLSFTVHMVRIIEKLKELESLKCTMKHLLDLTVSVPANNADRVVWRSTIDMVAGNAEDNFIYELVERRLGTVLGDTDN